MNRGVIVSFEGTEGSGKTTQAELLFQDLQNLGLPSILFREPGGTNLGERIREILLDPSEKIASWSELLLYLAARAELVVEEIIPALKDLKVVILDRYIDSTFAYQVFGRGLPYRPVSIFNRIASRAIRPDLTILVDIDPKVGFQRIGYSKDRIEAEDNEYHNRVREGYLKLARRAKKRIKLLDGSLAKDVLHKKIREIVFPFLKRKGYKL
ncbi:MAG TPA: dTMP kinase [bacterium (Candidatus Stahlbacteria)]|nr:dTMP kinase [Candidatus Stahlbacteria bacterium]